MDEPPSLAPAVALVADLVELADLFDIDVDHFRICLQTGRASRC
jgi:hypothetical protein